MQEKKINFPKFKEIYLFCNVFNNNSLHFANSIHKSRSSSFISKPYFILSMESKVLDSSFNSTIFTSSLLKK